MKLWLNQTAHVPLEKIRGFRAPYLMHTPEQRTVLQQNGARLAHSSAIAQLSAPLPALHYCL